MSARVVRTRAFTRAARKYAKKDEAAAEAIVSAVGRLQADPFDPRLAPHKLKGELDGLWAVSAGYDLRLVYELAREPGQEGKTVLLHSVGSHDDLY